MQTSIATHRFVNMRRYCDDKSQTAHSNAVWAPRFLISRHYSDGRRSDHRLHLSSGEDKPQPSRQTRRLYDRKPGQSFP